MTSEVFVKMSSDEQKLLDGLRKWREAQQGVEDKIKDTVESSKKLGLEQKKALDAIATPLDKYNAKLEMGKRLLDANKLSVDQYQQYVAKAREALDKANKSQTTLTGTVFQWAAGVLSAGKALQIANAALEYQNQLRKDAVSIGSEATRAATPLAQLAKTPQEYQALKDASRRLYLAGYGDTQGAATQAVQTIANNNMMADLPTLSKVASEGLETDLQGLVDSIAQFKNNMDGAADATTLIGQGLIAGEPAQGALRDVFRGAGTSSAAAKLLGISPEELLAATGVAMAAGGKEAGPTQLSALLEKLALNPEFVGRPLSESIRDIQGRNLSPNDLKALLGDSSAIKGFNAQASGLGTLESQVARTRSAKTEAVLDERLQILRGDSEAQADLMLRRGKAQTQVARGLANRAVPEMLWQAARAEVEAGQVAQGRDLAAFGYGALTGAGSYIYSPQSMMKQAADPAFAGRYVSPQLYEKMIGLLTEQNRIGADQAKIMLQTYEEVRRNRAPLPTQAAPVE